jgi:hypothetical protein
MKISEILESRGHKVIAGKLADIERRKEPQDGKSPAQMRAEKEKQQKANEGVAEDTDKYGYHTSVSNGKFLPSKYGRDKNNLYLHDMDKVSGQLADEGGPQLVTIDAKHIATEIAAMYGGSVEKTIMGAYRVYQPRGARQTTKRPERKK